jgi:hypothetical protein
LARVALVGLSSRASCSRSDGDVGRAIPPRDRAGRSASKVTARSGGRARDDLLFSGPFQAKLRGALEEIGDADRRTCDYLIHLRRQGIPEAALVLAIEPLQWRRRQAPLDTEARYFVATVKATAMELR